MTHPHYLVFAMSSSRVDDDIIEEIQNALDEYLEDEWDLVSWRRSSGTRFIIRATVQARAIISDEPLKIRMMTMSHMLQEMLEPNVKWLIPARAKIGTPGEMAERIVDKWLDSLWPDTSSGGGGGKSEDDSVDTQVEGTPEPPVKSFVKKSPADAVLEAFGLMGNETDSDGVPLSMFTISSLKKNA